MRTNIGMRMRIATKNLMPRCVDCRVALVRTSNEMVCPKCGLVEDVLE